jgi:signal transduction histidine kinase
MRSLNRLAERFRTLPPIAADAALTLAILPFGFFDLASGRPQDEPPPYHLNHWSFVLFAMLCLPLVLRRRNMLVSYALIQGVALLSILAHVEADLLGLPGFLFTTVLMFAVADRAPAGVAGLAAFAELGVLLLAFEVTHPGGSPVRAYISGTTLYFPPWAFGLFAGWAQRRRRILTTRLEARADDIRRERERMASQAVAGERIRIAHELRAFVFQGVERMIGQARVALRHLKARSGDASAMIAAIEATGRRTLVEMRRLLLVLRAGETQSLVPEARDLLPADSQGGTWDPEGGAGPAPLPVLPSPLRNRWVVDFGLVLLLAGSIVARWGAFGGELFPTRVDAALTGVILCALVVRSRVPFSVLCVIAVAEFLWILAVGGAFPDWSEEALLVGVYTVAAYRETRWAVVGVVLATLSWIPLPFQHLCLCLVNIGTLAILGAAAGAAMRAGRRLNAELETLTGELLRTRKERVRLAVAEERTRVAREMHDVVAHGITVMVVRAGGARMVADTDPSQAEEALRDVDRTGADAAQELQALLPALDPGADGGRPAPSDEAFDVRALVEHARRSGREILLTEVGTAPSTDEGLQASLYRIIQEALTNAGKHAPGATAAVAIRYQPQAVEVEVANGRGAPRTGPANVPGAGQGLIGIRERVAAFGGTVDVGPTPDGGFRMVARLPLEQVPA